MSNETIWRLPQFFLHERVYSLAGEERIDWGLRMNNIPDAWKNSQGDGVLVAVLDTGRGDHPDLPEAAFSHNFTSSRTDADRNGHSTHCAGIIGARANDIGVVGVAPKCNIGFCKVLGDDGSGSTTWIAAGIRKAIQEGANVISMSIGGGYSGDVEHACQEAVDAGCFIMAAAGNSGYRGRPTIDYPGKFTQTICVAAYDKNGNIANFSSGGDEIDVAAPGQEILSTYPGGQYRMMSGTSMATPFIAGLVALMIEDGKGPKSNFQLREQFQANSEDMGQPGKDVRFGFGRPLPAKLVPEDGPDERFYFL